MNKIVGVVFNDDSQIKYYYTTLEIIKNNTTVIVDEAGIKKFGTVTTPVHPIDNTKLSKELGTVVRIATKKDYFKHKDNLKLAQEALHKCRELADKYKLDMNVIDDTFTFNQEQLLFTFYADQRIDFRDLAKDLAAIYKTRIELRQIGVRDKAKKISGIGLCGQKLCCSRFMNDFDSVSISMAKNQNLSLNPTKINGLCGRLLCCLKYENECYKACKKELPQIGDNVEVDGVKGKVVALDVLKKKYKIETTDKGIVEIDAN